MSDKGVKVKYKGSAILNTEYDGAFRLLAKGSYIEDDLDIEIDRSLSESDEGKVVSNGALVAQTSTTKTANGTYTTTTNNEVVVAIPEANGEVF